MPRRPFAPAALALGLGSALLLSACASPGTGAPASPPSTAAATAAAPEQRNATSHPSLTLGANDLFGAYYSFNLKTSFRFDARGRLYPLDGQRQEDFINEHTPVASDHHCQPWGAGYNQRTVWFPDTAVLVAGGHLTAAQRASGQPVRLYALDWINENGDMAPSRPDTREAAYYRVPCVGATRVQGGFATDVAAPLQAGDRLWVRGTSAGARPITLTLPVAPFVVLEPHRAADELDRFGIAPMRLVLATVDMPRRRLVLHWQATAPQQPALRLVTYERWTAEVRDTHGKPFPAAMRHVIERHLSACPPAAQPPEPCAQPARYRSAQDLAAELSP